MYSDSKNEILVIRLNYIFKVSKILMMFSTINQNSLKELFSIILPRKSFRFLSYNVNVKNLV